MDFFIRAIETVQAFIERGGDVLYILLAVTFFMWVLIIERLWYLRMVFNGNKKEIQMIWEHRDERKSWFANKIRTALISQAVMKVNQGVPLIKTFVALCPLVGLLGTVTGMIEVFEVMAVMGSGNARAMAAGVSKATLPTMSGMVAALSGLFISTYLERRVNRETDKLHDSLVMDH